jgi:RHS repeat-associated protein
VCGAGSRTLRVCVRILQSTHVCSISIYNPAWQPVPPGGSSAFYVGADWFSVTVTSFGVETIQRKQYLLASGTWGTNTSPACGNNYSYNYEVYRGRTVACPAGYQGNMWTPGPNGYGYCWRTAAPWRKPKKNLGRSRQCDLSVANPVNVATGNKYQEERDYVGAGAFPLEYVRRYNSQAQQAYPDTGPRYVSRLPMWRGSYDKAVLFNGQQGFPAVDVYREDASAIRFTPVGGVWKPDADVNLTLTQHLDTGGATTGWTVTSENDVREEYDADGRLMSQSDRAGVTHTVNYDASGDRIASVVHSFGDHIDFNYDSYGRLATISLPGGGSVTYQYQSTSTRLTGVTYPDSRSKTYHYENGSWLDALTGITDESNTRFATYSYDGSNRVTVSEHAGGAERYQFAYPSSTSTTVTDPLNTARTWTHGIVLGSARALTVSSKCSTCPTASKSKSYDANGNPSTTVDFNDVETQRTYDLARNLETSRTEAYGTPRARTITTQWHSTFRLPTQIDEPGKRTTFTHDANGNLLTKTVLDTGTSESRTWTYTYNGFGQVLTANGPRTDVSDVTTYTYYTCTTGYQCGQVQTVTNALGHLTTYNTYNAHGQPLTITDPNGVVTTLTYDARQRLTSRTVGSEQTAFDYWPTGLIKKATLPDGSFLEYTYDAAHRLTEIEDSEGNRIVYTLDAIGNRTAENVYDPSNALTQTRTRVFNTLNQLWKEIGAAGTAAVTTSFAYDSEGNQTGINAPLSRNTTQGYDELNRLQQVTDPLSGITQYGYNALDQLISVTDPRSKVTSYSYNTLGDLTQQVSPDTGTTTDTYDSGGNLATSTDARSKTATYAYDALNRVTSVTYPDQTIGYTYDSGTNQKGRLTQLTDASGSTSWSYDTQGRVLSRQQSMGVTKSLGYAYDSAGRLQTLTLPSGNTISYGYTDGKLTSLTLNGSTTILSDVLYQPFGPTRGWTWGNSTLAIREYDTDGKVTDIDSAGLKTYSYDDAFRITGITDAGNSSLSQSYGYDLLDRITSAISTSLNQGWTYDANGNRLSQTGSAASTYSVSSTSNRLSSVSGALSRTYSYDNSGNTTGDGTATFTYNDAGRMLSATKASVTTTYALNALGQRVKKTTSGVSTYFVYDEAGHLVGEYNSAGNLIQETVWLGDTPVATLRTSGLFYIHTDHLNTPRRISRPSDNVVVWRWDSDAFGTTIADEDPDGDSSVLVYGLRFPGQYFDAETGLHYNYFRDYDPGVGRYVESDPIGLDGGINPYLYVDADPVSLMDELGLAPGQIFPTEAAAARDIEEYQSAIDDHNSWWLTQLAGDQLWVVGPYEAECGWTWDLVSPVVGFPPAVGRPNIGIQHSTRKAALDAGKHAHKGPPRPTPKKTDTKKRRQYEEQQRYRYPERHPGSRYPDPHYHDSNKSTSPVNRHHRYPRGR